jgi:acetyl-CoA carboxylase biotin carboxyl carrier protein
MRHELRSPVTGSVWSAVVSVGQKIYAGSTVVVLESMKMELPIESPVDGTVLEIKETSTQVVEGDVVAVVEG